MVIKIILIIFLAFFNSYSQELKEFELKLLDKTPPPNIIGGSKNPYLYIISNLKISKVNTNIEPIIKVITKGEGVYVCEITEKGKPKIYFHIDGYKMKEYKFEKVLSDREGFWFEIKSQEIATFSSSYYKYKIETVPSGASIVLLDDRKLIYKDNDSLRAGKQRIEVKLENYRDTILFITPSDKENSKIIQLFSSVGYIDFSSSKNLFKNINLIIKKDGQEKFNLGINKNSLINGNKLKLPEGNYNFEVIYPGKVLSTYQFTLENKFTEDNPLNFDSISSNFLAKIKFSISPDNGFTELKLIKDNFEVDFKNNEIFYFPLGDCNIKIKSKNTDYFEYLNSININSEKDFNINLNSAIAWVEFDKSFNNNIPSIYEVDVLTEKTFLQKIFGLKLFINKTSLGNAKFTFNNNSIYRELTSLNHINNPLRIFPFDFEKNGNLIINTDVLANFLVINDLSKVENKLKNKNEFNSQLPPGKYYIELSHSVLGKEKYIFNINPTEFKEIFITMRPDYTQSLYYNIYPGFGQIYKAQNRGYYYSSLFAFSLLSSYYFFSEYDSELSNYNYTKRIYLTKVNSEEVLEWNNKLKNQYSTTVKLNNFLKASALSAITIYTISLIDNYFFPPEYGYRIKESTAIETTFQEEFSNFFIKLKYAF